MRGVVMKKLLSAFFILLACACVLFAGCTVKYNAVLYDNAKEWIREDFRNGNPTELDESFTERKFLVDSSEKYGEIFIEGVAELTVDFDKQMLIIYTFSDFNIRKNLLKSVDYENGDLKIRFIDEVPFSCAAIGDTCAPYQRWFVVKLDKLSVSSLTFEKI